MKNFLKIGNFFTKEGQSYTIDMLEGIIETQSGKEAANKKERRKQVASLLKQEMLAKIEQQRTNAYWDTDSNDERLQKHSAKNGKEFTQFVENYEEICINILKNFDRVFTFSEGTRNK